MLKMDAKQWVKNIVFFFWFYSYQVDLYHFYINKLFQEYIDILAISSTHAWLNIISVATYHHFYFDSYCTSFSILISSSSSSITKQGMCESHNKLYARFAFFKSHEYRNKKKLHLFLLIRNYFSHAMIIQMVNICQLGAIYFLVKFRNVRRR